MTKINDSISVKNKLSDYAVFEKGKIVELAEEGTLYLNIDSLESSAKTYTLDAGLTCEENDLLMVMDGASSGKVYIGNKGIVASTLARIKTKNINSFYLYLYLNQNYEFIKTSNTGSAIPHANKKAILEMKIGWDNQYDDLFITLLNEQIKIKQKIAKLREIKALLLTKYFTNQ